MSFDANAFWSALEDQQAEHWAGIAATMLKSGFDVEKGARLIVPSSRVVIDPPPWVLVTSDPAIDQPTMARLKQNVPATV